MFKYACDDARHRSLANAGPCAVTELQPALGATLGNRDSDHAKASSPNDTIVDSSEVTDHILPSDLHVSYGFEDGNEKVLTDRRA